MSFFEHEQEVRYMDGILAKSKDWDWLIEYIEDNFTLDCEMKQFDDFNTIFADIADVFRYFNAINEYMDDELKINKQWVRSINELSLYYVGKKNYQELNLDNDFLKVFELFIFLAKLNNEKNKQKYTIYSDIVECRNLFKIIDISNFVREKSEILDRLNSVSFDTSPQISVFESNINKEFCNCTAVLSEKRNNIVFADCFSYQHIRDFKCTTWEEKYLLEMLNTSYENGELIPSITYTNGDTFPNFNQWSEKIIDTMKFDFESDDANFILESIDYAVNKVIPSEQVILRHANLLEEYYDEINSNQGKHKSYSCSSLEMLISCFNEQNVPLNREIFISYNIALNKINNIQKLVEIDSKYPITDKKLKKKIQEYIAQKLSNADKIDNYEKFNSFISDKDVINQSNNKVFQKVSDAFEKVVSESDGISSATLFVVYLQYLLKIKNNRNIIHSDISKEINFIRHLWKEEYFSKSVSTMHTFSNPTSIDSKDIENHNHIMIENPYIVAYNCMILNKESIVNRIEEITETPLLSLVTNIEINEDFPYIPKLILDDRHEIDVCYRDLVENIKNNNSYKFLNGLSIDEIQPRIYKYIKLNINIYFDLFSKTNILYQNIADENKKYLLLDYPDIPTLAHLTQLFPLLECKIREIGELFGISPIREDLNHFTKLKEPTNVLKKMIFDIYNETNSLESAADFMFIFFSMFAENGLNIRNSCIHGQSYNKNQNEINLAFKVTLFCIHLIEYRLKMIQKNISSK